LLKTYSDVQVKILRAIAKEKVVAQINSGDFIAKYRLKNTSSVSRALKKLMDNELVYKSEKGYILYDRFLGLWLRSIEKCYLILSFTLVCLPLHRYINDNLQINIR